MSIKQRIQKLEQASCGSVVVYITDPLSGEDEPVFRQTHFEGRWLDREPNEAQDAFIARANPTGQHSVCLEADTQEL